MTRFRILAAFLVLPALASAQQRFTFGAKGGIPLNSPTRFNSGANPFLAGPTVGIRLNEKLSLETGLLYGQYGKQRISFLFSGASNGNNFISYTERTRTLDIPVLAKYTPGFGGRNWKPFASAGLTLRHAALKTTETSALASTSLLSTTLLSPLSRITWSAAPTAGLGVGVKLGRISIEPEFRYSYWGARSYRTNLKPNQGSFLLGFRF